MRQENFLKIMAGGNGVGIIADTNEHVVNFAAAIVREDTVLNALEIDGTDVLTHADYANSLNTLSGQTLFAGDILAAPVDTHFTKVQLTSGSIEILNV